MAYTSLFRPVVAPALALALLLGGCCANNVCDCNDAQQDAIRLRFSTDATPGNGGFALADLDTITIQRYPLKTTPTTKPEIVTLIRTAAQLRELRDTIVLNNNAPFAQTGPAKLNRYRYIIQYLARTPAGRPVVDTAMVIDSVRLRGSLESSGCCTCYQNTEKTVFINGNSVGKNITPNAVLPITK
ncbi:MAG TPA: hypothetical protein VF690_06390 [Hymenobacter sp.]|jgi:hypothetical protein